MPFQSWRTSSDVDEAPQIFGANTRHCRRLSMSAAISQVRFVEAAMRLRTGRIDGEFLLSLWDDTACMRDRRTATYEQHADSAVDALNGLLKTTAALHMCSSSSETAFDGNTATTCLPIILERCLHLSCPHTPSAGSTIFTVNCTIDETCYSIPCASQLKLPLLYLWQFQPELAPLMTVTYMQRLSETGQQTTFKLWEGDYHLQARLQLYRSMDALWYTLSISIVNKGSDEFTADICTAQGLAATLQERLAELLGVMNAEAADENDCDQSRDGRVATASEEIIAMLAAL